MLDRFSKLGWYWHRLRAMNPEEIRLRLRKKAFEWADSKYIRPEMLELQPSENFPILPQKSDAPAELLSALQQDVADIMSGKWKAFGHLPLKVDDPPKWQLDHLVRKDFQTTKCGFKVDHREQPGGADIKIIWEPSRWNQLVRLAMAAYLLDDEKAGQKCVEWLLSWTRTNQPFTGLNWTSGLETGLRLVQFTWIDALLGATDFPEKSLNELRNQILPAHVWYTSRHRSFGSSANNHLIGELAGLILSIARWPELSVFAQPLRELAHIFDREVLLQFSEDGGNQEQALGYHLFSWEFCWQALEAFKSSGILVSAEVQQRLRSAGEFYRSIKPCRDPWDYGDSDNAYVTPFFATETQASAEWWKWFDNSSQSPALRFWWGDFPRLKQPEPDEGWKFFESLGYALFKSGDWFVRWDLSPLGYMNMAPHGHLDALHVSLWFRGEAIIVDPGTGAYYVDKALRRTLASWNSHNGPHPIDCDFPKRYGTFLWGGQHEPPRFIQLDSRSAQGELRLPGGAVKRKVTFLDCGFQIEDTISGFQNGMSSMWKFGPQTELRTDPIRISSGGIRFAIQLADWTLAKAYNPEPRARQIIGSTSAEFKSVPFDSLVSPAFRKVCVAPYFNLKAATAKACTFTIILDEPAP